MKKLLFSFAFASNFAMLFSQQTTIDFENLNLTQSDTFYNGSDNAGSFSISSSFGNNLSFSNSYFTSQFGDYWSGFSFSNMTDVTTAGYVNQYSAITGNGASNSEKYAVYTPEGTLTFSQNTIVDSLKITNTTYAYLSMLNGDMFGKQFGSMTNANGDVDGTNGEDFFKVWFVGINENLERFDSIAFYLADFRFPNNENDYIINSWENVNLTSLGSLKQLSFRFESSDISFSYINTPMYFALDNISISNTLALNENTNQTIEIYPNPIESNFVINNFTGSIKLLNQEGKILLSEEMNHFLQLDLCPLEQGIYFVQLVNESLSFTQKVLKL